MIVSEAHMFDGQNAYRKNMKLKLKQEKVSQICLRYTQTQ